MVGYPLSGEAQLAVPCTTHHKWRHAVCEPLWILEHHMVCGCVVLTHALGNPSGCKFGERRVASTRSLDKGPVFISNCPTNCTMKSSRPKIIFSVSGRHRCCQKLLESSNLRPQGKATPFSVDNYSLFGNTPYGLLALTEMECLTGQHVITQPELFS